MLVIVDKADSSTGPEENIKAKTSQNIPNRSARKNMRYNPITSYPTTPNSSVVSKKE